MDLVSVCLALLSNRLTARERLWIKALSHSWSEIECTAAAIMFDFLRRQETKLRKNVTNKSVLARAP